MFNISSIIKSDISFNELESQGKIHAGQGEYVVFHIDSNGEKRSLTKATFELVYPVLNQYAPAEIVNRNPESAMDECSHRFAIIKDKIKEIDPTLEIVFIPQTLYELVFVRKCIQEDLKYNKICPVIKNMNAKNYQTQEVSSKCWHLPCFTGSGNHELSSIIDIAFRLNKAIVKAFSPASDGFTYQELSQYAEREIEFLKMHFKNTEEWKKGFVDILNSSTPGPTINFGCIAENGRIKSMGIQNKQDIKLISNAIALECSKIAQRSFLLYRGANFQEDSPCANDWPYSLSYGLSLFAGCIFDGGATAFHYMRKEKSAYAVSVPFDQLNTSPFYIPRTGSILQLFGKGETFHARTKAWKGVDPNEIEGISGFMSLQLDHLGSNLTQEELMAQFEHYKKEAIQLK